MTGKTLEKYLIKSGNGWDLMDTLNTVVYGVTLVDVISTSDKFQEAFAEASSLTSEDLYVDMLLGLDMETVTFQIHPLSGEVNSKVEFTWPELAALGIFNS